MICTAPADPFPFATHGLLYRLWVRVTPARWHAVAWGTRPQCERWAARHHRESLVLPMGERPCVANV